MTPSTPLSFSSGPKDTPSELDPDLDLGILTSSVCFFIMNFTNAVRVMRMRSSVRRACAHSLQLKWDGSCAHKGSVPQKNHAALSDLIARVFHKVSKAWTCTTTARSRRRLRERRRGERQRNCALPPSHSPTTRPRSALHSCSFVVIITSSSW